LFFKKNQLLILLWHCDRRISKGIKMKRVAKLVFLCALIVCFSNVARAYELMGERTSLFEKRHYQSMTGFASMDYYLFKPANYDPKKKYPLVLTLHGASGHSVGAYVLSLPNMQQAYPSFILVPRAEIGSWAHHIYSDIRPSPLTHVMAIIKKLQSEFPIDEKSIYVMGYSMGGMGTFDMVAMYPKFFAAAVPMCGAGDTDDASKMTGTPMFIFHGALDDNIPVQESRNMYRAIKAAGAKNVYYKEYSNVGHNVWNPVFGLPAFWKWMFNNERP
jgi:predicted peptidase